MKVALELNGEPVELDCRSDEMLLDVLRREAALTSVRETCGIGVCGACTVLVDDEPISGCLLLAAQAAGRRVTTVEGLAESDRVVRAFAAEHAFQCGWCTPGLVLTARALLDEQPDPDESEIAHALGGNLCRCGSYGKIVAAVRRAAADGPPPRDTTVALTGAFTVPAPIHQAWATLLDVERIAPYVPGATLDGRDGDAFTGRLRLMLGPVLSTLDGSLRFDVADEGARRSVWHARARDGSATARITALLTPEGEGTHVRVETELDLSGPLARFGRGVLQETSAELIDQFAAALGAELGAPEGAPTDRGAPAPEPLAAWRGAAVRRGVPVATAIVAIGVLAWRRRRG